MNASVQFVVMALVVMTATSYAALKLMPKAWRLKVAAMASSLAKRAGGSDAQVRRVEAKLASGGACGSCDSCKACAAPAPADEGGQAYRRIPIRSV